jgi:hypothetical protein
VSKQDVTERKGVYINRYMDKNGGVRMDVTESDNGFYMNTVTDKDGGVSIGSNRVRRRASVYALI